MKNWLARLVLGSEFMNEYRNVLIDNEMRFQRLEQKDKYTAHELTKQGVVVAMLKSVDNEDSKKEIDNLKKDVSDLKKENYLLKSKIVDLEFVDSQTIRVQNNHDSMIYDTHKSLEYFLPKFEKVFLLVEQRSPFVDRLIREKDKKDYNEFKIKQFDQEIMKVLRGANEEK